MDPEFNATAIPATQRNIGIPGSSAALYRGAVGVLRRAPGAVDGDTRMGQWQSLAFTGAANCSVDKKTFLDYGGVVSDGLNTAAAEACNKPPFHLLA